MITPTIATTQRTNLFMRLRLEMDALPRKFDMLKFVFIVRHFFYASIDYRSFACSLKLSRVECKRAVRPLMKKYKLTNGKSGDFFIKKAKE